VRSGRSRGEPTDAAVAADEGIAETLRLAPGVAGAPDGARVRLAALGRSQHVGEGLALEVRAADGERADRARLARHAGIGLLAEQHDRRKTGARSELARPREAAAARPFIGQHHRIEPLREELARQRSLANRSVHDQLRMRTPGDEPLPDVRAAVHVFFDQEQPHGAITARAAGGRHDAAQEPRHPEP